MNYFVISLSLLCIQYVLTQDHPNNVCKTFDDYYKDLENNPNCYYNPDVYLSVPEIVQRRGYPIENYTAITKDGYMLTVFRIAHGRSVSKKKIGPPIFIQHGIATSSNVFVTLGKKSLAFVLADNGYDVWLGNFRGTEYSDKHVVLNTDDKRYWNFTLHELGNYDLPAQLDLVFGKTQRKVFYIGFSMGTTAYYVYNVEHPNTAASRIRLGISMAPVAFLGNATTPLKILAMPPIFDLLKNFLNDTTDGAILQRTPQSIAALELLCLPYPAQMNNCLFPKFAFGGFDYPQEDPETLPVTVIQHNDAVGVKNLVHFVQLLQTGRFQQFDYGEEKNAEIYGTPNPPQYNLSKVQVANYFIRGKNDPIATKEDVEKLYSALPKAAKPFKVYTVKYDKFTHNDFDQAKDVKKLVYDHIVKFLKKSGRRFN